MAKRYRAVVIGCGGMSRHHIEGYINSGKCDVVAVADINKERLAERASAYNIPGRYTDYKKMLKAEQPDLVSVVTWTALHAPMVRAVVKVGPKAIHCEKPIAPTWGEAKQMVALCTKAGVQLTFNHQRRFLDTFRMAKELANDGTIGQMLRVEAHCADLVDWGTHWFDMFFFWNNETPAKWVIGQIDSREERKVFGLPLENQGISSFCFENGVRGLLETGYGGPVGARMRILGTDGIIELHDQAPHLRYRGKRHATWKVVKKTEGLHGAFAVHRAIADLIEAMEKKREPELAARRALQSTEVIFATYESSRRRARIDLPLKIKDSPFLTMLAEGVVGQKR